jgi:hypothetical protein
VLASLKVVLPVVSLLAALELAILAWKEGEFGLGVTLAAGILVPAALAVVGWIIFVGACNAGIEVQESGVIEFVRSPFGGAARYRWYRWDELGAPQIVDKWFISVDGPIQLLILTDNQARSVLSHPNYTLRSQLPESVERRLAP